MHEAEDERDPLLERVKFLAIASSNIDEFFKKRIGGLKQQVGAQLHEITPDGRTPQQQIVACARADHAARGASKMQILDKLLGEHASAVGVWIAPFKELDAQRAARGSASTTCATSSRWSRRRRSIRRTRFRSSRTCR